ncbi:Mut7-C RNAse domain-containing protein [Halalkalicoccus sp. NIPERK01]|uniref:Mut7-C RNAse domain-containing protein n=1 Tax=Halalkalicoccus sp. NIPERK01 TaxID=3053469 RepID=UPI00256F0B1A|nr:Mut7-C RNAse domain-containing protein [Halalkalicoccus sp. NIPERK01]MDL5361262.1 Mut7-C RNAse domain-containing protein [Halalkalicoccus sp. NIPERK01]
MPTPDDAALLLDVMLGKLATYLRMCGYDTAYALDRDIEADPRLRELAREEGRTLLTRDVDLARTTDGALVLCERTIEGQLTELLEAGFSLDLDEPVRCSICNGLLREVARGEETPPFAPSPAERPVWRCRDCGQPFWRGSHWRDVESTLESARERRETYRHD